VGKINILRIGSKLSLIRIEQRFDCKKKKKKIQKKKKKKTLQNILTEPNFGNFFPVFSAHPLKDVM
jgi:hypothetical protein